jgi:predicted metal-dependent hydrolase
MKKWKDKADFKACVLDYAQKMDINVKSLALRPMTNKWASCSTDGNLNFNKALLDIDRELGVYVIVHELLHFNVPNHGKLWKSLMKAYLGDYENLEKSLKKVTNIDKQFFVNISSP